MKLEDIKVGNWVYDPIINAMAYFYKIDLINNTFEYYSFQNNKLTGSVVGFASDEFHNPKHVRLINLSEEEQALLLLQTV